MEQDIFEKLFKLYINGKLDTFEDCNDKTSFQKLLLSINNFDIKKLSDGDENEINELSLNLSSATNAERHLILFNVLVEAVNVTQPNLKSVLLNYREVLQNLKRLNKSL